MTKITRDKIKLFIVDRDGIFRLGLQTAIANYPDFVVIGEGDLSNDTLRRLTQGLILNVLVIGIEESSPTGVDSLDFCQRLQELYPQLPIFLITPVNFPTWKLAKVKGWGIKGYCDRASSINTVVEGLYAVAYGNLYWYNLLPSPKLWQKALGQISQSGRVELERTLQQIEQRLKSSNLSDWEKVFLVGRRRELLTARWLSNRLVAEEVVLEEKTKDKQENKGELVLSKATELNPLPVFADSANQKIFEGIATEIQLGLFNQTGNLLELDLLQPSIQKNLCHLIVKSFSDTIDKIAIADTIDGNYGDYLKSLWSLSLQQFLRQYYGELNPEEEQKLILIMERDFPEIEDNILTYIYGIPELMAYLLGKPGLTIDNINYPSDSATAIARVEFLLDNLVIQLANSIVQVILNNFYQSEKLKYKLAKSEYKSDRAIARFRNQLSWQYRQTRYIDRPQNIFESRHPIYVLNAGRIGKKYIYAPRQAELEQLKGIPWLTTIIIEFRDAIAPVVRKLIAFVGSGVVFVLTQVIGKGLGLIGKGIIQGIGSTLKDIDRK